MRATRRLSLKKKTKSRIIKSLFRPNWTAIGALAILPALGINSCKSTNPQTTKLKSAEATQSEIKAEITDLLIKPAQNFLEIIEPLASQFKSIQQIKAAADGAIAQADTWARRELESARVRHRENALLWELAKILAGPDGLLNYNDVKNTFACTPDSEIKRAIQFILKSESQKSSGYTKDTILLLDQHIARNLPLPPYRSSFNPFGFLNAQQRPQEVKNEINRQLARTVAEQCKVPANHIGTMGTLDLIKTYCIQALEWRNQGVLAGLLNLHYEASSMDKPGTCEGRILTQNLIQDFYQKYVVSKEKSTSQSDSNRAMSADFLRIQTAKYFGPFDAKLKTMPIDEFEQSHFINNYIRFPAGSQITLRGGLPVAAVKQLMDNFAAGNNNLLLGDLGRINTIFKPTANCKALGSSFTPSKTSSPEPLDTTYYKDEKEFRAYFDPNYDGEKYFVLNIKNRERLRGAIEDSRSNKSNAVLRKIEISGVTSFFHQSLSRIDFFGAIGSTLTRSRFTKLPDGRIRLDHLYLENATDGEFSIAVQQQNQNGDFELIEYEGYAIPYSGNNSSLMTPCFEFSAVKK